MEKFTKYVGTTVPLVNANIDTDQIIPKQFLKAIDKSGFGKNLFYEWRYVGNDYEPNPGFILNNPVYKDAGILVTGENFGCGSSREHAAWALQDYGFKVIIAGSYSDIFYNNALKNGLLPIVQPQQVRNILFNLSPDEKITVDLPSQTIEVAGAAFPFEINASFKHKLLNGLDDIGITLAFEEQIAKFEQHTIPKYLKKA
ncbi:MAG: 3-isopropylmalate dehydratase small subunit [Turicibacter sp.]|nr:3-isopropylmalate dehydratase small subunit [Turicibacter sp.]